MAVQVPYSTKVTATGWRDGSAKTADVSLPGVARVGAEDPVARAHLVCTCSNATRNNVDVKLAVV